MILTDAEPIEELDEEQIEQFSLPSDLDNHPKLFQHCVRLYDLLVKNAMNTGNDTEPKVYVGSINTLIEELGLSQSYQSKLVGRLRLMGCITMLKRGSGAAKSKWGMYKFPTIDDFHASDGTGEPRWQKDSYDVTAQRINDLNRRLTSLEDWLRDQGGPF